MGFSLKGYVLEPPRMGQGNSPFTAGPNNHVPQTLLGGQFVLTSGFNLVTTTIDLSSVLSPGNTIVFLAQLGVTYTIASVTPGTITLTDFFTGQFQNASVGLSTAYCPQIGPAAQAYAAAYPANESQPRDDYLVLVTSELAPGSGTAFGIAALQDNSGLIQVTVAASDIVVNGQTVVVSGVTGVPANGTWTVTVLDSNDFLLNGSSFTGSFAGGGTVTVIQGAPGLLTCAGFGWTKNEIIQRFDYDTQHGRFIPLPGGALTSPGKLTSAANTSRLAVAPPPEELLAAAPFRLSIGTFGSGVTQTVQLVDQDSDFTSPPPGTAQLSIATGNLNWNSADLVTYNNQVVNWQQQQYFALGSSTGNIGTLSTSATAPAILLNPIPAHGQFPLIRLGFLYWLTTIEKPDEAHFTAGGPVAGSVEWALDTGRLNFSSSDISTYDGTSVYYDGTLFGKDLTLPRVNLGPMPATGQLGPVDVPIPATGDLIFTVPSNPSTNSLYYQWPYYQVVGQFGSGSNGTVQIMQSGTFPALKGTGGSITATGPATFVDPKGNFNSAVVGSNISISNASHSANNGLFPITAFVNSTTVEYTNGGALTPDFGVGGTHSSPTIKWSVVVSPGIVQFAGGDTNAHLGQDVTLVFGDLPIDHGISIRFFRSYVNLTGQSNIKDVTTTYPVQNATWASPIQASPLVILPSTPVDDATLVVSVGQGTGTFTGVLNPVGGPSPTGGLGYLLDFDNNQLTFAERFQQIEVMVLLPTQYVQLPNTLLLASNIELALETGAGTNVFMPLTVGTDCLVDPMAGIIYFVDNFGVDVVNGSTGTFSGTTFTDTTQNFTADEVAAGDYLLVLQDTKGKANGVYQIVAVHTSDTLTTDVAAPAGSGTLSYEILSGKEILADRFFQTVQLTDPTTSIERITGLNTIQNATTIVPASTATFPDLNTLSDNSVNFQTAGVQQGDTITLTPMRGTAASFTAFGSGTLTVTGLSGMAQSFVGQQITFSGAATAGNNGTFTIFAYISPTSIQVSNPAGVAPDAHNGAIHWTLEQNTGTFLVSQVTQNTLTPTTSFVTVDPSAYTVTRRLQVPLGYVNSVRFRYGYPTGANAGTFSTSVTVVAQDSDFSNPATLAQGAVEISAATGNLNFASVDVSTGVTIFMVRRLALGTDYQTQPQLGFFQLSTRLLTNEEVLLTYTQAPESTTPPTPPAPPFVNERGTFLVRKELTQPHPTPTSTLFFNPTNHQVATNPPAAIFRGGRPQVTNTQVTVNPGNPPTVPSSITFLPDNILTNALPHGAIVGPNENVYVDYYVYQAMGGEQTLTVLNPPLLVASVTISSGTNQVFIAGDQTANFPDGYLMTVKGLNGLEVYQIGTTSYDAPNLQTSLTLAGSQQFQTDETNPTIQVASGPTPLTSAPLAPAYFSQEMAPYYTIARGSNSFFVPGDKTSVYQDSVVFYVTDHANSFTDFYLVTNSTYNSSTGLTQVTFSYPTLRQYTFGPQNIFWSVRPIFGTAPTVVPTSLIPVTVPKPEPVTVIRRVAGQVGQILNSPTGYTIDASGTVTYAAPLLPGEEFSIFYTGLTYINDAPQPVTTAGPTTGPRLLANYTATIVPDLATNGLLGQTLNADFTVFSPDNFYYRVETVTNFKGQVAQEIQQAAQNQNTGSGSGPMTSNTTSPALYGQGIPSVWFAPGDYANHDLIAQAALLYFNNAVNYLEDALHALDGRIVGDVDGRFLFDGVLGRYNYYTYNAQLPSPPFVPAYPATTNIYNQIDDYIQVVPGPLPQYPLWLLFFQQAYVTSPYSRFFKNQRNVFLQAPLVRPIPQPPDGTVCGTYNWSPITSLPAVTFKRYPRAATLFDQQYGQNTFFVDDVEGSSDGVLRPSWTNTFQFTESSIIGMLVVIVDAQGNYYVDESDNCTVVAVTSEDATTNTPATITISAIAHDPVGPTGQPASPTGGSFPNGTTASVVAVSGSTTTVAGLAGMGPRQVGLGLTLQGAASAGNNGTFTITGVISSSVVQVGNSGGVAGDANNGAISWGIPTLGFVPQGSTIYVSPIDTCIAQQATQDVDSGATGTYGMTYRIGKDVNVDPSTGNILFQSPHWPFNGTSTFKLPTIFIPQSDYVIPVNNGDALEADGVGVSVTYLAPYQFPALTGGTLDDDGNQSIPIPGPTFDGEITQNADVTGGNLSIEALYEAAGSGFRVTTTTPPYSTFGTTIKGSLDATRTVITLSLGPFPSPIPKQYDLVRIVSGLNGITSWRQVQSVFAGTPGSITVDVADAFTHQDSNFDFAVTVSAAAPNGLGTATLSGIEFSDSGNPFTGGATTLLGSTHGVVTVVANSYNTTTLDTIIPVPPSGAGADFGLVLKKSPYSIGDIVTGPGIAATPVTTITQIGPGNSIQLSAATTGGAIAGGIFEIQLTQPPPTGATLHLVGDVQFAAPVTGTHGAITTFSSPLVTFTDSAGPSTFSPTMVGQAITLTNCSNSANNGTYEIAGYQSSTTITLVNLNGVSPDNGTGGSAPPPATNPTISWTVPPSPTVSNILPNTFGVQIGDQVTDTPGAGLLNGKIVSFTKTSFTIDTPPSSAHSGDTIQIVTQIPDTPWSTTVDGLIPNFFIPTVLPPANPTDGLSNYLPLPATPSPTTNPYVSGTGITYAPPVTYTYVDTVVSGTSFTLNHPATASNLTGIPLAGNPTLLTIFIPPNVTVGWTIVMLTGPNAGYRRQIASIKDPGTVILDSAFPFSGGGTYRIDNSLNTYSGVEVQQIRQSLSAELNAIVNRTPPAGPPYVPNASSEQNALLDFFSQVFSLIVGPSNGAVSSTTLTDNSVDFIGPDPSNPIVTSASYVYVHLGVSGIQQQNMGIYQVVSVVDSHHLMVSPAFPVAGTVSYEVDTVFGISTATLQNLFTILATNQTFVTSTETFQTTISTPSGPPYTDTGNVPVLINGSVDTSIYANGLNTAADDLGERNTVVTDRIMYIQNQSTGPIAYIEGALATNDNLYAMRYSWINARINLQTGYLILQNQAAGQVGINQAAIFNQLIQLLTISRG
jgi:hypothetical protein